MSFLEFFSQGLGLWLLMIGLFVALLVLGIAVRFSKKKEYFGSILLPSTLITGSLIFLAITFGFPKEEAGPAAIPHLWIFWTVVLCSGILWQIFKGKAKPDPKSGRIAFLLLVVVIVIAYYYAMQIIGYFLSSFLFLAVMMHILSYGKKVVIYVVSFSWVVFSYLVFYKLLYIQLPLGFFENFF
jgi:hypothetical protein